MTSIKVRTLVAASVVALSISLTAGTARAQYVEAFGALAQGIKIAKDAYSAYKDGKSFLDGPQPTTADLLAAAVSTIQNSITDGVASPVLADAQGALLDFQNALQSSDRNARLAAFDQRASNVLTTMAALIPTDFRYAKILGTTYNLLLPVYLSVHLSGASWGSPINPDQLKFEFVTRLKAGLQLDYDMVGAKIVNNPSLTDTTTTSALAKWVKDSAKNQNEITINDDLRVDFFQTDPVVQAVQQTAATLYSILLAIGGDGVLLDSTSHVTVTIDPAGWTDNWRGKANAVWTSSEPNIYGTFITSHPCPKDYGMVAVWQMQQSLASFLCVPWPNLAPPNVITSSWIRNTVGGSVCNSGFCSFGGSCSAPDFASSAMMGQVECVHRIDNPSRILPLRGSEQMQIVSFRPLPPRGAQIDLPAGTALVGIDFTAFRNGRFVYSYAPYNTTPAPRVKTDFDLAGSDDLLWYNGFDGNSAIWYMNDQTLLSDPLLDPSLIVLPGTGWNPAGTGDFNVDGKTDILWHNGWTGETQLWVMDNASRSRFKTLDPSLNVTDASGWSIAGTGDFSQDGLSDILWRNSQTNAMQVWVMNYNNRTNTPSRAWFSDVGLCAPNAMSDGWRVVGTDDFNYDGKTDILWHNRWSGVIQVWYMDGASCLRSEDFADKVPENSGWTLWRTGDMNKDGGTDLIWRHEDDGQLGYWYLHGTVPIDMVAVPVSPVPALSGWSLVGH
ncbi:MAG TPA: VCBS repeat-containing protein [Polyangia bacterium]|nr:VCBS repeat-containing protein [Polyangia bacterium]